MQGAGIYSLIIQKYITNTTDKKIMEQFNKSLKKLHSRNIFLISICLCLFTLFFVGGPNYYSKPSFIHFWNIGHITFFTISNYMIIKFLRKNKYRNITTIALILLFTIGLGVLIELIQSKLDRSVDWKDIYRNLLGAGLALTLFLPFDKKHFTLIKIPLLISLIILILLDQLKFIDAVKNEIQAQMLFPVLADFEKQSELKQWSGNSLIQSPDYHITGLYSMRVSLLAGYQYSGFTFKHFPGNWEPYKYLTLSLYNPNQDTFNLNIKITDYEHDNNRYSSDNRFNTQIKLKKGWNHISISLADVMISPKDRKMDMLNISQIGFFTKNLRHNKIIYLDNLVLRPK
ncbi:MAG: hypothetical protein OQL19_04215 [Gammaproteobacteria bacterium]|nr:hypothetical protein [Gammaproteobacteria bacterium]